MEERLEQPRTQAEIFADSQATFQRLMSSPRRFEVYSEMAEFAEYLRGKYGIKNDHTGALDYAMYHLLAGSTPKLDQEPTRFDFPGDDSVEMFLKALETELQQEK